MTTAISPNTFNRSPRVEDVVDRSVFRMPSAYSLVRDVVLPRTEGVLAQVVAIEQLYHRLTGRTMPTIEAVRLLDQVKATRPKTDPYSPTPINAALTPVMEWMSRNQYSVESIYLTCREIERTGSAALSPDLDGEDREYVEELIPDDFQYLAGRRERFDATV